MNKIVILMVGLSLALAGCSSYNNPATNSQTSSTNAQTTNGTQNPPRQKLSDQDYYDKAFLISDATLSAEAQQAVQGFQVSRTANQDQTIILNLIATESIYHDQQFSLKPGEQVYFIDKNLGDDQGAETNGRDDSAVIVDAQGNIIQGPIELSN